MYGIQFTEIALSRSSLRDDNAKFVVLHGYATDEASPARQRAQAAWVRKRLLEQDIDVREFGAYHCVQDGPYTTVYFGH